MAGLLLSSGATQGAVAQSACRRKTHAERIARYRTSKAGNRATARRTSSTGEARRNRQGIPAKGNRGTLRYRPSRISCAARIRAGGESRGVGDLPAAGCATGSCRSEAMCPGTRGRRQRTITAPVKSIAIPWPETDAGSLDRAALPSGG
jgi:hypothetical protein